MLYEEDELNALKVLKLTVSNSNNNHHSYVDPWLLLMKNAMMYSDLHYDLKLLPGCNVKAKDNDSSLSEADLSETHEHMGKKCQE